MLRDGEKALSLADVAFGEASDRFTREQGDVAEGYTTDAVWIKASFRFEDSSAEAAPLHLALLPVYLDRIDIYVPRVADPQSAEDFEHFVRGDHALREQAGEQPFMFTVPVHSAGLEEMTLYLRVETTSALSLVGWLATGSALQNILLTRAAVATVLVTLTLGSAFLGLIYWVSLGQRYFLSFTFLVLADGIYVVATSGMAIVLMRQFSYPVNDILVSQSVLFIALANVLFVRDQLNTRALFPRFNLVIKIAVLLLLTTMVLSLFGWYPYLAEPALILAIVIVGLFIYFGCRIRPERRKPGLIAAISAGAAKLLAGVFAVVFTSGTVSNREYFENVYWIAIAIFIPLMALSLAERVRYIEGRRRSRDALRFARRTESSARKLVEIRTAELKKAKETAETALLAEREAQVEQLRFVDVVRHQYQTPLAVITNSAGALMRTLANGDADNLARLSRIKTAVGDLVRVLDVSLHRSRLQGAAAMARRVPVDIGETVTEVVNRARSLHGPREIKLSFDAGAETANDVAIDPDMLAIALANLIDNAIKFSPGGGGVEIICRFDDGTLSIEVLDRGVGVPDSEAENLGKRYFRASNAGGISGTGLGLHIVRSVGEAHGGGLSIENRNGGGARAVLSIPSGRR